jgi:1,4-dihydroxy-2-naphthoate octaprenyltransferase
MTETTRPRLNESAVKSNALSFAVGVGVLIMVAQGASPWLIPLGLLGIACGVVGAWFAARGLP